MNIRSAATHSRVVTGQLGHVVAWVQCVLPPSPAVTWSTIRNTLLRASRSASGGRVLARLDRFGQDVRRTVGQLDDTVLSGETTVSSELPGLAEGLSRTLLVSRSTLRISALQLIVLAGLALMLMAGLLASERSEETAADPVQLRELLMGLAQRRVQYGAEGDLRVEWHLLLDETDVAGP